MRKFDLDPLARTGKERVDALARVTPGTDELWREKCAVLGPSWPAHECLVTL